MLAHNAYRLRLIMSEVRGDGSHSGWTYDFIGASIRLLRGPSGSVGDLTRLATLLNQGDFCKESVEDVESIIKKESPVAAKLISRYAPKDAKELIAYLRLFILVGSLIFGLPRLEKAVSPQIESLVQEEIRAVQMQEGRGLRIRHEEFRRELLRGVSLTTTLIAARERNSPVSERPAAVRMPSKVASERSAE